MMKPPPSILGIATRTPTPPSRLTSPTGVAPSGLTREQVIADLYAKHVMDKSQVAKAVVKLKLNLTLLADALGLPDVKALLAEFVNDPKDASESKGNWSAFGYEEARIALYEGLSAQAAAEKIGRTPKAVQNFRWRTFTQGLRVNQAVWELIRDGHTPEEINELGHPLWMCQFAETVWMLNTYALLHRKTPPKVELV